MEFICFSFLEAKEQVRVPKLDLAEVLSWVLKLRFATSIGSLEINQSNPNIVGD